MSHVYHESLPGYLPEHLLFDGCPECEQRAASPTHGIETLDLTRFRRAWERAAAWQAHGEPIAVAEAPMLSALWAVQVQFERASIAKIGELPFAHSYEDR